MYIRRLLLYGMPEALMIGCAQFKSGILRTAPTPSLPYLICSLVLWYFCYMVSTQTILFNSEHPSFQIMPFCFKEKCPDRFTATPLLLSRDHGDVIPLPALRVLKASGFRKLMHNLFPSSCWGVASRQPTCTDCRPSD